MRLETNPAVAPARGVFFAATLVVVAGLIAYANSFSGEFVFDDFPAIRDNPTLRALWPPGSALSPPANTGVGGRPLANLSFAVNYAIGGSAVHGYHVVNLLLHLGSALLLFGLIRRSVRSATPWFAGVTAALWVAHPLTTGAVTWLSQRTEVLMAFWYLLTLYAFVRSQPGNARPWLITSVVACALGMLSKEVMVTAPVVVLLYDRTFVARTFRAAWRARRGYYLGLAATWLVLAGLLTTGLSQRSVGFGLGVSPWQYAFTEVRAVLIYLKLALWPAPLIFDYGAYYAPVSLLTFACMAAIGALLAVIFLGVRRGTAWGFAAACFFLLLAPTSSFVPIAEQPIAENRAYLPLAALTVLAVSGLHQVMRRIPRPAMLAAGAALATLTLARNAVYRTEVSLWADSVQQRPLNPRANYNHGIALLDAGRAADARPWFERAIQLKPSDPKAHNSLGNALLELGRPAEAIPHYAEAVRLDPRYGRAWCNYGTALFRAGDAAGAIARFERAAQLEPADASVQQGLGNAWFQREQPARAIAHYEAALRLDPTLADVHYSSGNACAELNRFDEAIAHFTVAVRLRPADAEFRNNFGAALLRAGRTTEAIAEFETALRLKPDYADARDNLGLARAELGRKAGR